MVDGVCACGIRADWPGASDPCLRARRAYQRATSGDGVVHATHLDPELAADLAALAEARGLSRSAVMREAIQQFVRASQVRGEEQAA